MFVYLYPVNVLNGSKVKQKLNLKQIMYTFRDNWYGDVYSFRTLKEAKREAQKMTYGHSIAIYRGWDIVAVVSPDEDPLP